jgi:hypothetical protein
VKHGGGPGTVEEQQATPWRHDEYMKLVHVGQTARAHGGATCSTSTLNSFIRSATIYSEALQVCFHHKDEGSTIERRVKEGRRNNASNSV